jgi:7-cyano-7-deazaguanine reductase
MSTPESSPLGREAAYPDTIDAGILFAIPRAAQRDALGLAGDPPFRGEDIWTTYELSWLGPRGKPQVAIATLRVPCDSPSIVESKSLKLYLNGFAQVRLDDDVAVADRIAADLSTCCGVPVGVELWSGETMDVFPAGWLSGTSIDEADIELPARNTPCPVLLGCVPAMVGAATGNHPSSAGPPEGEVDALPGVGAPTDAGTREIEETLVTRLFRSNCPVTGQPDWADIQIHYRGKPIDRPSLLAYLVSYRGHRGFHEQCVERIFLDIKARCEPAVLTVYARFTRRGGLDINPWRSDDPAANAPENVRTARQ